MARGDLGGIRGRRSRSSPPRGGQGDTQCVVWVTASGDGKGRERDAVSVCVAPKVACGAPVPVARRTWTGMSDGDAECVWPSVCPEAMA